MGSIVEVRRLLHTNYNCVDVAALERWYSELFSMQAVMRAESDDTSGVPFGLQMDNAHRAVFLYDHRGARRITSLELVQWVDPPTIGRPYPNPWDHGIQALGFVVPDLGAAEARVGRLGGSVFRRGENWLLVKDPEGVNVEIYEVDGPAEHRHLRVVVHDLAKTADWWACLGFEPVPGAVLVPGEELWSGDADHDVTDELTLVATDDPAFAVNFTTWSGPPPVGPTYGAPFHQGLYRMAMAVDDVHGAWEKLRAEGVAIQPPYTFKLPGTKITEGLTILFLRDPDGILVELVERPRALFS